MPFPRYDEHLLRQVLEALPLVDEPSTEAVLARLEHLQRGLEPENELALILAWLGKCQLVHKLGQEQLPLGSSGEFKVPDLLAVFEHRQRRLLVLIEVKTTKVDPTKPALRRLVELNSKRLSVSRKYQAYADLVGLPLLVAWRIESLWALFELRHATLAQENYKIDFESAMRENLLGSLAGDFSYRLAPGTRIRMSIRKLTEPDPETGGLEGRFHNIHIVNPLGQAVPGIPLLSLLFLFWENDVECVEEGEDIVQSYVAADAGHAEFASRTLSQIVCRLAAINGSRADWAKIVHQKEHLAHDNGRLAALRAEGVKHGVITNVFNQVPRTAPLFL